MPSNRAEDQCELILVETTDDGLLIQHCHIQFDFVPMADGY